MTNRAWVTLATNDSYALGALVLGHSLRRVNSVYSAVVLVTPSVTENMRGRLGSVFAEVVTVDVLDSRDAAHLALLARPELGVTFTKIHCWNLTQYDKCVFLDADTLVLQNSDELFDREELSAAPDVGWPDCFNSGVFVFAPSRETFDSLLEFAKERGSFDGGDQGLLNSYFSSWARGDINKHLPFLYNVTSIAFYSYLPALKQFGQDMKIAHFIGNAKPWLQSFNWETRSVTSEGHLQPTLQLWWDIFVNNVHSQLDQTMTGLAGTLSRLTLGAVSSQQSALDEHTRRQGWESGNIDYLGADSFDNIWAKISATLAQSPPKSEGGEKPAEGEVPTVPASVTPVEPPVVAPQAEQKSEPEPSVPLTSAPVVESSQTTPAPQSDVATTPAPSDESALAPTPAPTSEPTAETASVPKSESSVDNPPVASPESESVTVTALSPESNEKPAPVAEETKSEIPAPEVPVSAVLAPEVPAPEAPIPEVPAPESPVPGVPAPEAQVPEVPTTEALAPKVPASEETVKVQQPTEVIEHLEIPQAPPKPEVPVTETPSKVAVSESTVPTPSSETVSSEPSKPESESPVVVPEPVIAPVTESPVAITAPPQPETPSTLLVTPEASPAKSTEFTPEKGTPEQVSTDSPPLINTPIKDSVEPKCPNRMCSLM